MPPALRLYELIVQSIENDDKQIIDNDNKENIENIEKEKILNEKQFNLSDKTKKLFIALSNLILSNINVIQGEILFIFNTKSSDIMFQHVFDLYSMDLISTNQDLSILVIKKLIKLCRIIKIEKSICLTKFLWGRYGFRQMIKIFPLSITGYEYIRESIFSTITRNDNMIEYLEELNNTFDSLVFDLSIRNHLIKYLENIFDKNIAYTYDSSFIDTKKLSSYDYLILAFNILIKIIKFDQQLINEIHLQTFWKALNVVFIQYPFIKNTIELDIKHTFNKIQNTTTLSIDEITHLKDYQIKGVGMIQRLKNYYNTIDHQSVDEIIYQRISHPLNNKNYDLIQRLISSCTFKSSKELSSSKIVNIVLILLSNKDIPVHIKFDSIRLLFSHDLKQKYFDLRDKENEDPKTVIANYIKNDTPRLGEIKKLHLIDLMIELSETSLMSEPDIFEMYMYIIPEFIEQYVTLLQKFKDIDESIKPMVIQDIVHMYHASKFMIRNLPVLGKNGTSYIDDILSYCDAIVSTQNYLEHGEDTLQIFDLAKDKYIENIKLELKTMFHSMKNYNVMLNPQSEKFITNILKMSLEKEIKVISMIPEELTDSLSCDLVTNPYFIKTSESENEYTLHLIDRKTLLNIAQTKTHPFTREYIDLHSLEEFNNSNDILENRIDILKKINQLYESLQ